MALKNGQPSLKNYVQRLSTKEQANNAVRGTIYSIKMV